MKKCNKPCDDIKDISCSFTRDNTCCIDCTHPSRPICLGRDCACPEYVKGMEDCRCAIDEIEDQSNRSYGLGPCDWDDEEDED